MRIAPVIPQPRIGFILWLALLLLSGVLGHEPVMAAGPASSTGAGTSVMGPTAEAVRLETKWNQREVRPGDQVVLAVVVDIAEGYHVNAGQDAVPKAYMKPTRVGVVAERGAGAEGGTGARRRGGTKARRDEGTGARRDGGAGGVGARVGPVQFPEPQVLAVDYPDLEKLPAYAGRAVFYVPIVVDASAKSGEMDFALTVQVQACDDKRCYMPATLERELSLSVNPRNDVSRETSLRDANSQSSRLFAQFDHSVFARMQSGTVRAEQIDFYFFKLAPQGLVGRTLLVLLAALGGLLLNFTPCVLPVIPLKVMSLSKAAGSGGRRLGLGLAMAGGVVGFWLAIGLAIAWIADFTAANQLFQSPWFTIGIGLVIAGLAIGMGGLFSLRLPGWVYHIRPRQDSYAGSLGLGVMTAVLSTPCTAPFMGAAAAWATQQHSTVTLVTFSAIGAGMALPYLLLAAVPGWLDKLPKTGPASELIKQVMGLAMLAAAAYFLGVGITSVRATPPAPPSLVYWWVVVGLLIAAAAWAAWRIHRMSKPGANKVAATAISVALAVLVSAAALGLGSRLTDRGPIHWVYYTPQRLERARENDQVVVMDFTADWCLNCKFLEQRVLFKPRVVSLLAEPGVTPMKVDLTNSSNAQGSAKLKQTGRVTIPLLVVYDRSGKAVMRSDYYSVADVVRAVRRARQRDVANR